MEEEGRAEKQCGSLRYSTLSSRVSKAEEEGKEVIQLKGIRHSEPYTRILPTITISSQVQPTVWLAVVGTPCAVKHVYCIFDGRAPNFERKSLPYLGPRDA